MKIEKLKSEITLLRQKRDKYVKKLGLKETELAEAERMLQKIKKHDAELIKKIEAGVCAVLNVEREILTVKWRKRKIVEARHTCVYLIAKYTKLSYEAIAWRYGYKRHCSVNNCNTVIRNLLETDRQYAEKVKSIEGMIEG